MLAGFFSPLSANLTNYVLETSPGRFQAFYLLDAPATVAEAKPVAEALKRFAGCDHGTVDMCHVWRIPGTLNWPTKKKLDAGRAREGVPVRVREPWDGSLTSLDELRAALEASAPAEDPAPEPKPKARAKGNGQARPNGASDVAGAVAGLPNKLRDAITRPVAEGEDRSGRLRFAIGALVERGHTDAVIEAIVRAHPEGVGHKYVGRPDLAQEIARIRGKTSAARVRAAAEASEASAEAKAPAGPPWPEPLDYAVYVRRHEKLGSSALSVHSDRSGAEPHSSGRLKRRRARAGAAGRT